MCRILAVVGGARLKRAAMESFHALGQHGQVKPWEPAGHLDGWGVSVYEGKQPAYVDRSPNDVSLERERYQRAIAAVESHTSQLALVHFRKSTCGVITEKNTHPFHQTQWLFCHNGTVEQLERIGDIPAYEGSTDSEALLHMWAAQDKPLAEYPQWLANVAEQCPHTSVTSFVSDGRQLLACRRFSFDPLEDVPAHFNVKEFMPQYYTIYHWQQGDQHILCSEKLEGFSGDWSLVAANNHVCIDIPT